MASSFGKYTGGIQPVQGLFEMGASIGKNYAAGITAASENIAKGVEDYYKVKGESQYADAELDSEGEKYKALAEMLGSEPETAHLVEGVTPILEAIAKGRKGSHSAKMAAVSQVKAQGKALTETFQYMGLVRGAKERRLFDEANGLPPEGEEVTTKSFGLNTKDTQWSPNLSYTANVERVKGNYRKWLDLHKNELASGKFRVMSEDDFLKDWKRRLPTAIQNSGIAEQDKAWAMDIINQNQLLEGMSDEDMGAQGFFMQDWATINPYRGSGEINAVNAPAGTVAQEPASSPTGKPHPNAVALQDENERLIAEANRIKARVGKGWFGGNDDVDRPRLQEIAKQINDNNTIINSLGGAPSSSQIRNAQARGGSTVPPVVFGNDTPVEETPPVLAPPVSSAPQAAPAVIAPPKVVEETPAVVAPKKVEPSVDENGVITEKGASDLLDGASKALGVPQEDLYSVYTATPEHKNGVAYIDWINGVVSGKIRYKNVFRLDEQGAPAAPAKASAAPAPATKKPEESGKSTATIVANEELAVKKFNKQQEEEFRSGKPELKRIKLGDIDGVVGNILGKYGVNLTEFRRLNPSFKHEDDYAIFKGGRRIFNKEFSDTEIVIPIRKGRPKQITSVDELPDEIKQRLIKQNGRLSDQSQRRRQQKAPEAEIPEPVDVSREASISRSEAEGGMPDESENGTPPPTGYIDKDTGNLVLPEEIAGIKPQAEEGDEDGVDMGQFEPIKLKPLGTRPSDAGLPSLPNKIKPSYTKDELDDIKIATRNVQENLAEVESQNRSVTPAIDYLERIKENVLNGNATSVDFGTYGQWQKEHPDAAQAISAGTQAAALWIGGGWSKTLKFKNNLEKANFASKRISYARELAEAAFDSQSLKLGRQLTDAEIGTLTANAFKKAGLVSHKLDPEDAWKIGKAIGKSSAKSAFWETLALSMAGVEHDGFALPDTANDKAIRTHLKGVLSDIRQVRHTNGGYNQWIPFGLGSDEISSGEIKGIKGILDAKIAELKQIQLQNEEQKKYLKANATPDNLLKLAKALGEDSKAKLAAVEIAKANGYQDPTEGDDEIDVGGQSVASKDFIVPQSHESRKKQMMEFMKGRLGYVPAGFDDMWRKNNPESTLQIKETPYGVFYSDKTGEWKQMQSTGGKQLQPHEVAANRAVQFGTLQPDGNYTPTEFIAGSGIKLGGIGTFGTPSEASKFRVEYTRKIKALRYADELRQMNEITFRSGMPSQWGKSKAKVAALVAQMRQELIGVGSVSDFEQKLLKDLVADPTDFFRLQSTVRSTYEELIDKLARSLVEDPQSFGLEVQMPKDKQAQLKNMRAIYLSQQERYKSKMAEFQKQEQQ